MYIRKPNNICLFLPCTRNIETEKRKSKFPQVFIFNFKVLFIQNMKLQTNLVPNIDFQNIH